MPDHTSNQEQEPDPYRELLSVTVIQSGGLDREALQQSNLIQPIDTLVDITNLLNESVLARGIIDRIPSQLLDWINIACQERYTEVSIGISNRIWVGFVDLSGQLVTQSNLSSPDPKFDLAIMNLLRQQLHKVALDEDGVPKIGVITLESGNQVEVMLLESTETKLKFSISPVQA